MKELLEKLENYGRSDHYPFHMPGHKRREIGEFPNPFSIDITEIHGFDNLHHAEGILKESMEETARIYGADKSYYLVNGSTCGILSAICTCTGQGGRLLMARNSHKAAYHAVILKGLQTTYLYPQQIHVFGINGGIEAADVEKSLREDPKLQAVFVVSPTYDGIVSDIEAIANICHKYKVPLIVDEAHGAHLPFADHVDFPKSALECGADVVIESLHKTLPSLTQTAILHVKGTLVNPLKIERYLGMFQSSSPSYVFMAAMERCVRFMEHDGREEMKRYAKRLRWFYKEINGLKVLKVLGQEVTGKNAVYDWDMSKIIISTKEAGISGERLCEVLREKYHLELEMSAPEYAVALTSLMDTEEGLLRLADALKEIDKELTKQDINTAASYQCPDAESVMPMGEAMEMDGIKVFLQESEGKISQEFVYLYPPGIPLLAPGEQITKEIIGEIRRYRELGLAVQGLSDPELSSIITVAEA